MARNLSAEQQVALWIMLDEVQETFPNTEEGFLLFAQTVINTLIVGNPDLNRLQADMCRYLFSGPLYRMLQAQRGQAKTTLTAIYAIFRIIHAPHTRILIFSQKGKRAEEIAGWCIKILRGLEFLSFMLPDKASGDKESVKSFDIHWVLKGSDKSPSISCESIEAGAQGARADVLIADDIESPKNGLTVTQRGHLLQLSKEFSSICTHGDILYLGTPQSKDSIYNTLPARGFGVRIWPGRFPTAEEQERYGDKLAPYLSDRIKTDESICSGGGIDGSKGKPSDPHRYTEYDLCEKELDKGPEDFQLQYMLDTSMVDAMRQQLKLSDLLVANYDWERLPEVQVYQASQKYQAELPNDFPVHLQKMYNPVPVDCLFVKPKEPPMMFIDPAGGGVDELSFGVSCSVGPYIHLLTVGGLKGGLSDGNSEVLVNTIRKFGVKLVKCESNMGHGLFEINLRSILAKHLELSDVGVIGEYSTGQKERRIIDSFVSATQRHRVIIHKDVFDMDTECGKQHSLDKRKQYSFFYQFANITTDRNSLTHDDRLEAAAGAVRHWKAVLVQDEDKAATLRGLAEAREFMSDPMGYGTGSGKTKVRGIRANIHKRR